MQTGPILPTSCPNCQRERSAMTCLTDGTLPKPGDPIVCDGCGAIHTIDDDGATFRGFTSAELNELESAMLVYPELARQLGAAVGSVRLLRFGGN